MTTKIDKKKYQRLDQIEHILKRSDMYCGSSKLKGSEELIAIREGDGFKIIKKYIEYPPALLRIFIEVLSNAIDNVERSKNTKNKCTKIDVKIDKVSGIISVWNNGEVIPIELNEEGIYNHSMIFGQLLTGSNYDDDEERFVSGKNGLGAKIACVFSKTFTVRGFDPENKKSLIQEWTNNMRSTKGPIVKDSKLLKGYTEVTYVPEFERFGMEGYTDDIISLYTKYIIDAAMLCDGVKLYLNDENVLVKTLSDYAKLYNGVSVEEMLLIKDKSSQVLLTPSMDGEYQAISFVNGIFTKEGGAHVDEWTEALFRPLLDKFNKKKDKPTINIANIKQYFKIFVVSVVDKPVFSSQEKTKLESPTISVTVKTSDINKILKWSIVESINDFIRSKEMKVLKKTERKRGYVKIEGLDPANNAGGKLSSECSLILCEGLSAKTYAVAGIEHGVYGRKSRQFLGVMALRGKVLNCRNASPAVISKNNEISNIIKALNLRYDVDYLEEKNFKTLNYGRVILLCDADCDGLHISGLILNFFHALFPSLMKRNPPYIVSLATPIVRVFKKGADLLFYDERKFEEYALKQSSKFDKKYYKGLGTTKPEDIPDTFGKKIIEFINDENVDINMNKVFNKSQSNDRKLWLTNYEKDDYFSLDDGEALVKMKISDFLNGEMIKFSLNDCSRSIPNMIDGLKTSQRKVLFSVKKKNLKYSGKSLKVAQLGGFVAEQTNYHHGEQNLYDTIVKMANEYVGSNNIPLLARDGMFSTRLNGKDAASARYIYTKMDMLTLFIFRPEDDVLLDKVIDDGDEVEPKFYVPIIPMILVNGVIGSIGTGFSSSIPNYNPIDLIKCIKIWLLNNQSPELEKENPSSVEDDNYVIEDDEEEVKVDEISLLPDITPWYRDFEGVIEKCSNNKYISKGIVEKGVKNTVIVKELPIGYWTDSFKEYLEDLIENKVLSKIENFSTPNKVHFVLTPNEDKELNIDTLKLYTYLHTSNMVLFTREEKLKKYTKIDEIIDDFCKTRFEFYIKRKKYLLDELQTEILYLQNKLRFITEVMDKTLLIMNISEEEIIKELDERNYTRKGEEPNEEKTFNYLLHMQIRSFSLEKVNKLKEEIEKKNEKLIELKDLSEKDMWIKELDELESEYYNYLKVLKNTTNNNSSKKSKLNK